MANELKVTITAEYTPDYGSGFKYSKTFKADVTGDPAHMDNVQTVGTTEEAILLGDVATGGYWIIENLDPTNFVEIRSGTGATDIIRVGAGKAALVHISSDAAAPFAIADTAAVKVRFIRLPA